MTNKRLMSKASSLTLFALDYDPLDFPTVHLDNVPHTAYVKLHLQDTNVHVVNGMEKVDSLVIYNTIKCTGVPFTRSVRECRKPMKLSVVELNDSGFARHMPLLDKSIKYKLHFSNSYCSRHPSFIPFVRKAMNQGIADMALVPISRDPYLSCRVIMGLLGDYGGALQLQCSFQVDDECLQAQTVQDLHALMNPAYKDVWCLVEFIGHA